MSWLPSCPVYDLTGLYCMTCGATRAIMSLAQGQILTALRQNALIVLSLPPAIYQMTAALVNRSARRTVMRPIPYNRKTGWILLTIALLFMLVRNLPIPLARFLVP
jgi:TusA-related sulfurtransferase